MHPILITIGGVTIHTYGFLLAVGVLAGIVLSLNLAKKAQLDIRIMSDFLFYSVLIGLVGAKLWLFITEIKEYLEDPGRIPSLLTSAGTFYGGLIFGLAFVIWYVRKHELDFKVVGDVLAPGMALAHFFGRMGCFSAGCCWGRTAEGCSIAVEFTSRETTTGVPHFVPLYPTQLIEAILNLLNFIFLIILFKKKKFNGQAFIFYIFNYSVIRFFVEFFRGDDDRGYIFGGMTHPFTSLSVPQLVSIIGVISAIILYKKYSKERTPGV
jgi:phosphatidylglycerol---prolipoprotein diacylglyceryl transferase